MKKPFLLVLLLFLMQLLSAQKIGDTIGVVRFPNQKLKQVELARFEGAKNVRLTFAEDGRLMEKIQNFDSYPRIYTEYGANKKPVHQRTDGDVGGCIATVGTEYFWDSTGVLTSEIRHSHWDEPCSMKVLVEEKREFYPGSKSLKSVRFTNESYEGSEPCACGIWKTFDKKGKLLKQKNYGSCKVVKNNCKPLGFRRK